MAVAPPMPGAARRPRRPSVFWSRLHFLIRLLGLTGALVACVAGVSAGIQHELDAFKGVATVKDSYTVSAEMARTVWEEPITHLPTLLLLIGAVVALAALLVEGVVILCFTATRRSAFGFNALLQGALAAFLLVALNVWSFDHHTRIDCTRDRQFTLPPEIRQELAQLDPKSKTTIVVYQRHKTFGSLSDKPQDDYDTAAERKVVEKIQDLAELLRENSSQQLKVELLDTQAKEYKFADRLAELTKDNPQLRKAIEAAPESSLFFSVSVKGKPFVQQLSFNNFYLLDKTASQEDHNGRGNLVLLSQGLEPFVQRLTHLEAKRPRIGIAVIHPLLSSLRDFNWSLTGLRAALEKRGFEVKDIVLKKWPSLAPVAATVDESTLERLVDRKKALENGKGNLDRALPQLKKQLAEFQKAVTDAKARDELSRRFADQLRGEKLTAADVQANVREIQAQIEAIAQVLLPDFERRLRETKAEISKFNVDAQRELQHENTDVQAKLNRLLADCDLLLVPRLTLWDLGRGEHIYAPLYNLDDAQVEAVKEFLKSGKPMLACFGPTNLAPGERRFLRPGDDRPDGMENVLADLGIKLGKQTVLFDREFEGLADAPLDQQDDSNLGSQLEPPPPVLFDWSGGAGRPPAHRPAADKPHRIRQSLQLLARALGKDAEGKPIPLGIRIRHPRPVYYDPPKGGKALDYDPVFLMADPRSWNEDQPFRTRDSIPQYERPGSGDKTARGLAVGKDSLDARRRGPFPIGVAVEERLPSRWYGSESDNRAVVRVAAIGQGGFFTGKPLPPAEEKLMVETIDWLLGRDDQLPIAGSVWSYPRVNDTIAPDSETEYLWLWGVRLGLPVLFAFLGLVVLLFRRLR